MSTSNPASNWTNWVILVGLTIVWGSSFILYKEALKVFSWQDTGLLRICISGLSVLPVAIYWLRRIGFGKIGPIALVGLFGSGIPPFLFALAQTKLDSALTGILNSLTPIFTLLIGMLMFQLKSTTWKAMGLMVGLAGAVLIMLTGADGLNVASSNLTSGLYVVIATACYATSANLIKARLQEVHPIAIGSIALLCISIPCALYFPFSTVGETMALGQPAWAALGYISLLAVFGTVIASMLYFLLVQRTDPIFGSMVTYLIPLVAIAWGVADGERIMPLHYVGMLLILGGVWMTSRK